MNEIQQDAWIMSTSPSTEWYPHPFLPFVEYRYVRLWADMRLEVGNCFYTQRRFAWTWLWKKTAGASTTHP